MGEIIEMNGKGRIVIPKRIREELGLVRGSKLIIESDGKQVCLRRLELKGPEDEATAEKNESNERKGKHLREFLSEG